MVALTGVFPFASIYIELHFVLTSVFGHVYYYCFGFMLAVFAILAVVLVCTAILAVYVVLNNEVRA